MLNDTKFNKLKNLIQDSFRIRPNHDPIYVDVSNHLQRLKSNQHQIIFGRRGTGKSCLLVHFSKKEAPLLKGLSIYIDTDEIKKLEYPDVLIRLLLSVFEKTPSANFNWFKKLFKRNEVHTTIKSLRTLLDQAKNRKVKEENSVTKSLDAGGNYGGAAAKLITSKTKGKLSEFEESKLDSLERYLSDYKRVLSKELEKSDYEKCFVILDDFYLIKRSYQPDVIDYMHRLFRGTEYYLKVGTVRHRTNLLRNDQQTIGVELGEDVEEINLDRTLDNLSSATEYLSSILNSMGDKVEIKNVSITAFNPAAFEKLVLASGGVPRDLLTIFVQALDVASAKGQNDHLVPTHIWKAASSLSYNKKLKALRDDVYSDADIIENVFRDLLKFCLLEKKKTCFLISQDETQLYSGVHEIILQLMDFKLIHVVEPDTSAASGRAGRFEAYTLDFSIFMEPRKRGIEMVEFWKYDEGGRRIGVRESPTYSLERANETMNKKDSLKVEDILNQTENEVEED